MASIIGGLGGFMLAYQQSSGMLGVWDICCDASYLDLRMLLLRSPDGLLPK